MALVALQTRQSHAQDAYRTDVQLLPSSVQAPCVVLLCFLILTHVRTANANSTALTAQDAVRQRQEISEMEEREGQRLAARLLHEGLEEVH